MIYFFDSSSLVKRYLQEPGSMKADHLLNEAERIIISAVTKLESLSTFRRVLKEGIMSQEKYNKFKNALDMDFTDFVITPFGTKVEELAAEIIDRHQLKTLDAIQLSSALMHKDILDAFVASDKKLKQAAEAEGLKVLDPLDGI